MNTSSFNFASQKLRVKEKTLTKYRMGIAGEKKKQVISVETSVAYYPLRLNSVPLYRSSYSS